MEGFFLCFDWFSLFGLMFGKREMGKSDEFGREAVEDEDGDFVFVCSINMNVNVMKWGFEISWKRVSWEMRECF